MSLQNLYRTIENTMAAVAFAEAGEPEEAVRMAFPKSENERRKEIENQVREENRPRLRL